MKELYQQFTQKMVIVLAELLAIIAEVLVIGLSQLVFSYGSFYFLLSVYIIARLHILTRNSILKLLTRE